METAFNTAAHALEALYTNDITVNITAYFSSSVGLGESETQETGNPAYTDIVNALRAAATTTADGESVASLSAGDPTSGGT